jgi:hypothetical protein
MSNASEPVPTIRVRRGCISRGKAQLRIVPRATGISTSATARKMNASAGV